MPPVLRTNGCAATGRAVRRRNARRRFHDVGSAGRTPRNSSAAAVEHSSRIGREQLLAAARLLPVTVQRMQSNGPWARAVQRCAASDALVAFLPGVARLASARPASPLAQSTNALPPASRQRSPRDVAAADRSPPLFAGRARDRLSAVCVRSLVRNFVRIVPSSWLYSRPPS